MYLFSFDTVTGRRMTKYFFSSLLQLSAAIWLSSLVVGGQTTTSIPTEPDTDTCSLVSSSLEFDSSSANVTYINPHANVIFTVVLPYLDCHSDPARRRDSLIYLNAVEYALNLLNNGSAPSADNALLSVMDFFPLLKDFSPRPLDIEYGAKIVILNPIQQHHHQPSLSCNGNNQGQHRRIQDLTVLDGAKLFDNHSNKELLEQIPIISLTSSDSILTTSFKTNLIINLLDTLDWKHFAVITTKHEDSLHTVKILGQIAYSGHVCISDIFEWPTSETHSTDSSIESSTETRFSAFVNSIFHPYKKIPILVISNDEKQISKIVQMLSEHFEHQISNHQFFFSLVPSPELLVQLRKLSKVSTVFTLSSQLPDIPNFVQEDKKVCDLVEDSSAIQDSLVWRKWLSFLPIRSVLLVALAFNTAYNDLCRNINKLPGGNLLCDNISHLERKMFFKYLTQMEDHIESTQLSLGTIDQQGKVDDLLLYNGDDFSFLKSNYSFASSNCIENDCNSCIKFRQSRNDDAHFDNSNRMYPNKIYGHANHNNLHVLLNQDESSVAVDDDTVNDIALMHVETFEVTLGLLLPLHKSGQSILECSSELNLPAYYIYEASRWIIDKINQNNYLIPGIEIKLELIDTCSSPFYATQELAHLTSSDAKVQPIAFVSSVPRDHYKQIVDFVSSINYTIIASQDISFMDLNFGPQYGVLQTAVSSQNLVKALVEQLKYFGWRYVSVVVDAQDLVSTSMLHYLSKLTASEKICFASVEQISNTNYNQTLSQLLDNHRNGANVVVLLTNFATTVDFMSYYQTAVKFGHIVSGNLHFVLVRDQNLEMVHGFEEEYLGSIFIRESMGSISHYDNHFLNMLANPRKEQLLYKFLQQCGTNSAQCLRTISSFDRTVTANTMQAILATIGGFARMRNETCEAQKGICNEMLATDFHRKLSKYILNTRSMRIDSEYEKRFKSENFDIFEFSPDGSSGRDIEVLNFKHDSTNGLFRFDTVALYSDNLKTFMKNPNVRYVFYRYNGLVNDHKEFNETDFISSDCLNLKKCSQCEPQTPEFIYMPSWDNLLITGIFDVHAHSPQNPLICQKNMTLHDNVQNVEAFLWAIDLINNDPNILPGVHLGALIFDTCSSYQKVYRDISNFLSDSLMLGDYQIQIPTAESVIGFVVDGKNTKIIDSILDLTNPLHLSVLAPETRETRYNDIKHYSQFLGLSSPNSFYTSAILSLLKKYSWSFVSVLYENNNFVDHRYLDAFEYFQSNAHQYGVNLAVKELFNEKSIENNVRNLNSAAGIGSKVVVLFLSPANLRRFLHYLSSTKANTYLSNDIVHIAIDSESSFLEFTQLNLNVISISEEKQVIPEFKEHFLDLSLKTNIKNPWFTKLWEKAYDCKGFSCYRTSGNLRNKNITVNTKTTNVINSVFALAHGLELIRQKMCPNGFSGLCRAFHNNRKQLSHLEYHVIKQNEFSGLDNSRINFSEDTNYLLNDLNVLNLQMLDKSKRWVNIGRFNAENGLMLATSKSKVYTKTGSLSTLDTIVSTCQDINRCEKRMKESDSQLPLLMIPSEDAQATIALIIPLHRSDRNSKLEHFTCGPINAEIFEKFMAFFYGLDQVNQLTRIPLNIMIVDSCAFSKNGLQQLASIQNYKLLPKIVSVISLSTENVHLNQSYSGELANMLADYNPFVYHFHSNRRENQQSLFFNQNINNQRNDDRIRMMRSIVDLCVKNKWLTVNLVYSSEFDKNYFLFEANKNSVCVDQTLTATKQSVNTEQFKHDWIAFGAHLDSQVIVLLTSEDINELLIKYADKQLQERSIWIGDTSLQSGSINAQKNLRKSVKNIIVLSKPSDNDFDRIELTSTIDNLSTYLDLNNQRVKNRVLNGWLHEYWQRKFSCFPDSKKHDPKCFESRYARKALVNVKEMKTLIDFSKVLSNTVSTFVFSKCLNAQTGQFDDLCLYNYHLRNEMKNKIIDDLNKNDQLDENESSSIDDRFETKVLTQYGKHEIKFHSHDWPNVSNSVDLSQIRFVCKSSCRVQLQQSRNDTINLLYSDSIQSPLTGNMGLHRTWAIVASVLSTLGLILVLICVLYFILIFPVALGTTIIGYQILLGLFTCFLINFAYLLPVTNSLCLIRQVGLPIAYCVIVSGFFVKVYNYWCQLLMKKSTKPVKYNSPLTQLSISFAIIFLQIMAAVLGLYIDSQSTQATIGIIDSLNRCHLQDGQVVLLKIHIILPITILATLFFVILFFTLKTFDNQESRWILTCSILTSSFWIVWFFYTWIYQQSSSLSIVVTNLVNTFTVIALLYLRKLYLFSKISRKILKERRLNMERSMQCEPFADSQQQYGAFKTCSESISWNNLHDRINYGNATRSPFEGDNDDNVSSCGSVKSSSSSQVQCQELYPMDVYDNQLSQSNSKMGQSTRSIYDIIDDANSK